MIIAGREIGRGFQPFMIAEMSGNHNQELSRALRIVEAAAKSGADALKLQTYTADSMTFRGKESENRILAPGLPWHNRNLYELYATACTPWEWHAEIINRCSELGMICFSSPFDAHAVDFLQSLQVPAYKVASFECTDLMLLRKIGSTGKPVILSTGMANADEISIGLKTLKEAGAKYIAILKCTSSYPAEAKDANIKTIPYMREMFGCEVGISDHTAGIGVAVGAVALGASIVEKHLTLSRAEGGVDSTFSLEPSEFKSLVTECRIAHQALGEIRFGPVLSEESSIQFRRSLYAARDLQKGEKISENSIKALRPFNGISAASVDEVIGKEITRNIAEGSPINWADIIQ